MLGIAVLGPMRVAADDGTLEPVGSRRQRVLLAVLVSRVGRVVNGDELVEALWGADLPEHPTAALQSQVFRLRRQLRSSAVEVANDGAGYRLTGERGRLDVTRFEDLIAHATASGPAVAVALLGEAMTLWRGRAYLEVADHPAVQADAMRLEELRADVAEQHAALVLELGDPREAAAAMEALMHEHPLREGPVDVRMRALARAGRHVEAVRVYEGFRRHLAEELGLSPSPALRQLEIEIVRHEWPAPARIGLPGNSLVGRDDELSATISHLARDRLVTLTGPGGVGKSRLAVHVAARAGAAHPDGLWLCELATIERSAEVAAHVASVLQLQLHSDDVASDVVGFLGTRQALLVLDNCEHVLDAARELVMAILARAPEVDILVTSRRRLGVEGERVVAVAPLDVAEWDDVDSPAVVLFVDRATAARSDFVLGADDLAPVCELCRRVGGLPLALELAASHMVSRTPTELLADLAARVDRLGDPLRAVERHRSIHSVLSASYDALDPLARHVLRTSAVFAGSFTPAAAAAAADVPHDDVLAALTALVEHSLLVVTSAAGATRFSMLEPVRQFAETHLTDAGLDQEVRRRHAAWTADWIEAADVGLRSADEAGWAAAVAAELGNLRFAHQWALAREPRTATRIAGAMFWFAVWYGAVDAFEWARAAIGRTGDDAGPDLARAFATAALGAARSGDMVAARTLAERGIAAAGNHPAARFAWEALSSTEMMSGNYRRTVECQLRAFELAGLAGDATHQARERAARALALGYLGQVDAAESELVAATELLTASANPTVEAFCWYVAGELRLDADPAAAMPLLRRARDVARALGNRYLLAIAGVSAVSCEARIGRPNQGLRDYAELLEHFDRTGSQAQQWTTIRSLVETLTRRGADEAAATLLGAITSSSTAPPLVGADATRMARATETLSARLGDRYCEVLAAGAALSDPEAFAYARRCAAATTDSSVRAG